MKQFNTFDKVLFRNIRAAGMWQAGFYDYPSISNEGYHNIITYGFLIADKDILPFNDQTKHLLGTSDDIWIPKKGEVICVRNDECENWRIAIFEYCNNGFLCVANHETHKEYECGNSSVFKAPDYTRWLYAKPYTNPFKE